MKKKVVSDPDKLLKKHQKLIHTDHAKVTSHVQRGDGEWLLNTIMIEGVDVPFRYKRKVKYKNLTGSRVNLTYYPDSFIVAGIEMEAMKVVRIKLS
ncbi:MAG: hypothetical protein OEX12_01575 [Gammaproteobacteria bacterium]|nr:hypothetical protein [Gammaproteobacteria bacterium]